VNYYYGWLYGALLALAFVNALLYAGLHAQAHLLYALYLLTFIAMNMSYTGHALAWLWPQQPQLQRFLIYSLMVLFSCSGLAFASRFLELSAHAPRLQRAVVGLSLAAVLAMATLVALQQQMGAGLLAFGFMTVFTLCMVGLGLLAVRDGRTAGRYFLAAVGFGMAGAAVTTLCVWGVLPVNAVTYHAVELGVLLEALLLAQALAVRMRHKEQARSLAERQARQDALTGLSNRRGFIEAAAGPWSTAERGGRPLAVVMLDIDHFKDINDVHGHAAGDLALVAVARRLTRHCRTGDIVARWGGEEFVMLLPETDLGQACALAERLRHSLVQDPVVCQGTSLTLSASFGVAQRGEQVSLEALIEEADQCLYDAKRRGRNRVSSARGAVPMAAG
jgi:diguanylate cyclase (GGDEF)-like protein